MRDKTIYNWMKIMTKTKSIAIIIAILLFGLKINAQEYLNVFSYGIENSSNAKNYRSEKQINLPFFDDFSNDNVVPDASKWMNNSVFVNSGFPSYPINHNAATFDVLDATGKVYSHASSSPFVADSLISNKIKFDNLTPADSLYFSFYYQPQGKGDAPEASDSLVLMFGYVIDTFRIEYDTVLVEEMLGYMQVDTIFIGDILYHDMNSSCNPDMYTLSENQYTIADSLKKVAIPCDTVFYSEMVWNHIWSSPGMTLDSFLIANDGYDFQHVMIPVVDKNYFEKGMVVLFYNYASITTAMYPNDRSNVDNWNIDFVYLDKNRSYNDVSYPLVSLSEMPSTFLRRYNTMPYRQYKSNPTAAMASKFPVNIVNTNSEELIVRYSCNVENIASGWTYDYAGDLLNVYPYSTSGMYRDSLRFKNFLFDMDDKLDTASYLVTHIISVEDESSVKGDTLYGIQSFNNYYSYDDGTPERGYGVVPDESYFATQFSVSVPDTLCGVQLLFNRTHNDANYDFFDIIVWNDNNGRPGNEYYRLKNQRPIWDDEEIYKFAYYPFDEVLKVNGTIYVGIMQHSRESINIGFDTSKDNSQYNFYETGGGWSNSAMQGSLMIRPVLGSDYVIEEENDTQKNRLGLYPIPSKNEVNISELPANACEEIMIFDMTGRTVKRFQYDVRLDVSDLSNGLYMIRVITDEGKSYTEKFLISK